MTNLERTRLRRELEKSERLMELDERTRTEVFKMASEAGDAANICREYKRLARVARMAMRRGANLEADRQWKEAMTT